jgi:hypothetical protein
MIRRRVLAVLLVLGLLAATAALTLSVSTAGAAPTRLELDGDQPLATDDAVATYEAEGVVSREFSRVAMTGTIADDHADADVDGVYADAGRTYICLDYQEDLPRTVRLYLPGEYLTPRAADLSPIGGKGPTATLTPIDNGTRTALEVTLTESGRHCYAAGAVQGAYSGSKSWIKRVVGNWSGVSLPSLSGGSAAEWSYVNASTFENASTHTVPADATVQYDRDPRVNERAWVTVPGCSDGDSQAVCQLSLENGTMLKSSDPRNVRYRTTATGPIEQLQSGVEDAIQAAREAASEVADTVRGWL